MNPTQRLANLASMMMFVLWFDVPLLSLLESNVPNSRYAAFRVMCERVLGATKLTPAVVILALKYVQEVRLAVQSFREEVVVQPTSPSIPYASPPSSALTPPPSETHQQSILSSESQVWAACLLLAHKFVDDKHFANATFASVHGLTASQLNRAERECLRLLDFRLMTTEDEYNTWRQELQSIINQCIVKATSARPQQQPERVLRSPSNANFAVQKTATTCPYSPVHCQTPLSGGPGPLRSPLSSRPSKARHTLDPLKLPGSRPLAAQQTGTCSGSSIGLQQRLLSRLHGASSRRQERWADGLRHVLEDPHFRPVMPIPALPQSL
ncbi:hypothetical protein HK102_007737 [Quaeritorhiza haematococci]|nr:hypothetical protein HK102_007737 [Quaeritorhiza haematococci]